MGDYLSSLVTKNIGTANILQPRRAARFEPIQTKSVLDFDAPTEPPALRTENFEETRFAEPLSPPTRRRREVKPGETNETASTRNDSNEQYVQALFVSPIKISSIETEPKEFQSVPAPPTAETIKPLTSRNLPIPSSLPEISAMPFTQAQSPKSVESREKSNDVIEQQPIQKDRQSVEKIGEPKRSRAENSEQHNIESRRSIIIKPHIEKIENRLTETAIRQTVVPKMSGQMPKPLSNDTPTTETQTINVTIGRVEIRAVAPSPTPRTPPPPKPHTLSLEEYLRKRGVGGER